MSASKADSIVESRFSTQEVVNAARESLDFLAALALPTVFQFGFPPVFQSVWQWLLQHTLHPREFPQLALGLPRGFGKTTLMKLYVLYCILFTDKKFILVVSSTATLAENFVADVVDMLSEPNILKTFGDWRIGIEKDTQSVKKFGFRGRNIILAGLGAGTSLRGLNMKNTRPDVMIFEDIQTREQADSETLSFNLETWMQGTAMKAKSPHGCAFVFVANMYPTKFSILRKLKYNPTWIKFIAGGILADGSSLWEDLQPIAQLTKEFDNDLAMGRPEIFYAEVLNDENASSNNLIDLTKLPSPPFLYTDVPGGNFVVIDPASGKSSGDDIAIGYFEVLEAMPVLQQVTAEKLSPGDTIRTALTYCLQHNCRLVAIESVAYQSTLGYWFNFICQQMGISGIECVEIYPRGGSKNSRILTMLKSYAAGEIFVNPSQQPIVHAEISQFNPLLTNNTDNILDLLCYAPRVIAEFGEYVVSTSILEADDYAAIPVRLENSCF